MGRTRRALEEVQQQQERSIARMRDEPARQLTLKGGEAVCQPAARPLSV